VDDVRAYVPPTATPTVTPSPTPVPTSTPTPTPTGQPTNTPTPLPATVTPTPTTTPTSTPIPSPTPTSTPYPLEPYNPTGFTFNADYIILTFSFTDGTDLDTRSRISFPNIGQNEVTDYLGYCAQDSWPTTETPIISFGGDNTGTGYESIFVNLIEFKNQYPLATTISVETNGTWYGEQGFNPVIMQVMLYKGGTVTLDSDNFLFVNNTYTGIFGTQSNGVVVTEATQDCIVGTNTGTLTYNLITYNGQFI
jgi:hypothetical protein